MRLLALVLAAAILLASLSSSVFAATCSSPRVRKEWRTMTKTEQAKYLASVGCLMKKDAKGKQYFSAVQTRFDDFAAMHINATQGLQECTGGIHLVAKLWPWHRYAVWLYETALRDECSYDGAQPYWDWTLDASNFTAAPVFDPVFGFGGNGNLSIYPVTATNPVPLGGTGGGCVQSGWFSGSKIVHLQPGATVAPASRCLIRNFNLNEAFTKLQKSNIAGGLAANTFLGFNTQLNPFEKASQTLVSHTGGHLAVGGDMGDTYSSSIDPLFWLHHAQLDRLWTTWQEGDPTARTKDIAANSFPCTGLGIQQLSDTLWVGYNGAAQPISNVMDTQNRDASGILCYKYA